MPKQFSPCIQLQPFVDKIIITETYAPENHKVLPATNLVLGFQFRGTLSVINDDRETPLNPAGITGITDRFQIFGSTIPTGTVLVYLKEAQASAFLKIPAKELFSQSVPLENLMDRTQLSICQEKLDYCTDDPERVAVIQDFLLTQLAGQATDPIVSAAIKLIYEHEGNIRIRELAQKLHSSLSPLEKKFNQSVGTSPKKFAAIVRFNATLNHFRSGQNLTSLAYASGFFDQSHFIKEFYKFAGESPSDFFLQNG